MFESPDPDVQYGLSLLFLCLLKYRVCGEYFVSAGFETDPRIHMLADGLACPIPVLTQTAV